MATKQFKPQPTTTVNGLNFLNGALNAATGTIVGSNAAAVPLFTLPAGAVLHNWAFGISEAFTQPGSVTIGVAGTVARYAAFPTPTTPGTHTIAAALLNTTPLAADTAVIGTFFAAHGTTPGTLSVTCMFSLPG